MSNVHFVYFGHDITDVYTALALDDVLANRAVETNKHFIRTYEFKRASVVLGCNEDVSDIKNFDSIDFTRRKTGGSIIWLDKSILAYCIVEPRKVFDPDIVRMHHRFGSKIGRALRDLGVQNVYIGERFSISLAKNPYSIISGNSGSNKHGCFLYHGVLVVNPLNIDAIRGYVKLRKTEDFDELEVISKLPSLETVLHRKVSKEGIAKKFVYHIPSGSYRTATEEERRESFERAKEIVATYRDKDWIFGRAIQNKKSNLGFCLIAPIEGWKEDRFYSLEELQISKK